MKKRREIAATLVFCIYATFLAGWMDIASVIGQPGTAIFIFLYGLFAAGVAFAAGRESVKP